MSILGFFSAKPTLSSELPDIFPLSVDQQSFIRSDIEATYTKILTDTLERTYGLPKELTPLLWDNCVQNESSFGLVSLLVQAMVKKTDLYLVYVPSVRVLRLATQQEQERIRSDYQRMGESAIGVYVSFRNYRKTQMLQIYAALEYCILTSLHKSVNIAKAVQIKISDLRGSVALSDAEVAKEQARSLATALKNGADVYLDAADEITTATPDISATEKAIGFLDAKRAFYLDLPISYISGLQTPGIGSSGEADTKAIERGLKQYFFSIVHPVLLALFGVETEFKSQDFRQMGSALEALKTFELVSNEILSTEAKTEIIARLFDLDKNEEDRNKAREARQTPAEGTQDV